MPFYAVHKGRGSPAIYNTWPECKRQVDGLVGAVYKKFENYTEAEKFMQEGFGEARRPRGLQKAESYEAKNQDEIDTVFTDGNAHRNLVVYTDGSCLREGDHIYCGYGIVIPELGIKYSSDLEDRRRTNNRAEMRAILHAVEMVGEELRASRRLCIFTDSQYCKYIFQGTGARYERDGFMKEGKEVPNRDMIEVALRYLRTYEIAILKVRAHTDATDIHSRYNALADGLANEGSLKQKMGRRYVPNQVIIGTPIFHDSVLHPFERRIPAKATTPQIEAGAGAGFVDPSVAHRYSGDSEWREEEKRRLQGKTSARKILDFVEDDEAEADTEAVPVTPRGRPAAGKAMAKVTEKGTKVKVKTFRTTRLDDFLGGGESKVTGPGPTPTPSRAFLFSDDSDEEA